jgi:hypothetical protein
MSSYEPPPYPPGKYPLVMATVHRTKISGALG